LIQVIKLIPLFEQEKYKRWLPFLSALAGIVAGIMFSIFYNGTDFSMRAIFQGIIVGTSACGLYSTTFRPIGKCLKKPKSKEVAK